MTSRTLVSKAGAPVVELSAWVESKNNPSFTALFAQHVENFTAGREVVPMENPELDEMFNQFFAETNQELV